MVKTYVQYNNRIVMFEVVGRRNYVYVLELRETFKAVLYLSVRSWDITGVVKFPQAAEHSDMEYKTLL